MGTDLRATVAVPIHIGLDLYRKPGFPKPDKPEPNKLYDACWTDGEVSNHGYDTG